MNVHEGVFQYSVHAQNCEGPERSATIPNLHWGAQGRWRLAVRIRACDALTVRLDDGVASLAWTIHQLEFSRGDWPSSQRRRVAGGSHRQRTIYPTGSPHSGATPMMYTTRLARVYTADAD